MIKLKDSIKLAAIKFRTRKIRNFFSGCSLAIGVITIIIFLLAANGIGNLIQTGFRDSLDNRYFSSEQFQLSKPTENLNEKPEFINELTDKEYRSQKSDFEFKNIYRYRTTYVNSKIEGISKDIEGSGPLAFDESLRVSSGDKLFVNDFIDPKFIEEFENKDTSKPIPVVIPKQYILDRELKNDPNRSAKETYEQSQKALNKFLGFETKVSIQSTNFNTGEIETNTSTEIKVKIIGYHLGMSIFDLGFPLGNTIVFPNWFYETNETFKQLFITGSYILIPEFQSKDKRDQFNRKYSFSFGLTEMRGPEEFDPEAGFVLPITSRFEAFNEIISVIRNFILGISALFLVIAGIFILTTVAKIVSDSKKEIGVFRAIGAQRLDITKIFFSYTFILTTAGFLLGLVLAVIVNSIASLVYGDSFYYQIGLFATSSGLQKPPLLFVGFPIIELTLLYLFILLVGFLAALIPIILASRLDPIIALREE